MGTRREVTETAKPATYRLTAAERRAAKIASLSTKQAELKQEAAERRAAREGNAPPPPQPPEPPTTDQ